MPLRRVRVGVQPVDHRRAVQPQGVPEVAPPIRRPRRSPAGPRTGLPGWRPPIRLGWGRQRVIEAPVDDGQEGNATFGQANVDAGDERPAGAEIAGKPVVHQ